MSEPITIDQFKPPRRFNPGLLAVVVAVVVLAVVLAVTVFKPSDKPVAATPSRSPSTTARTGGTTPVPVPSAVPGVDFKTPSGAQGHWEITKTEWQGGIVSVYIVIRVDKGKLRSELLATDNVKGRYVNPLSSSKQPEFRQQDIQAGQTSEGWISFDLQSRQAGTLLLMDGRDTGSALPIKG